MNFHFKKIILWMKNGNLRTLDFQPNKINIITGGSNTGKSALFDIIDYCFFASDAKISDSIINENVIWYGVVTCINGKDYTVARTALKNGKATNNYYFSSVGLIPKTPHVNNDVNTIKELFETEFSIDSRVAVPFGGRYLQAGSKFSLRYFMLFNTLSQDTITNSTVFFDKQKKGRYQEALERIFDLAIGVDTIENIIFREKEADLIKKLKAAERKQDRLTNKKIEFENEVGEIVKLAKEYELISGELELESALNQLYKVITEFACSLVENRSTEFDKLKQSENQSRLIIRNLERLNEGYKKYKESLKNNTDSLKPIEFLQKKRSELVKTSIFSELVNVLEKDLLDIKEDVKKRTSIECNLTDLIAKEKQNIERVKSKMNVLPQGLRTFSSEREKHFFMGKLYAQLDLYTSHKKENMAKIEEDIKSINDGLKEIAVADVTEQRKMTISLLEEIIQNYIDETGSSLENYSSYHPQFDYREKVLSLRKPLTDYVDSVGSSSNHLFLHLFLFIGLHEIIKIKNVPFVPPFLIIDQPSRPYWGETEEGLGEGVKKTGDAAKIRTAFRLLDLFIDKIIKEYKSGFQMIVLEHVPPEYWDKLKNVHLVEEFIDGNALIREEDLY